MEAPVAGKVQEMLWGFFFLWGEKWGFPSGACLLARDFPLHLGITISKTSGFLSIVQIYLL